MHNKNKIKTVIFYIEISIIKMFSLLFSVQVSSIVYVCTPHFTKLS